jgi:hypothetical protein
MHAKTSRRIALGLIFAPILIIGVMYYSGSKPVIIHLESTVLNPSSVSFEARNFGFVLVIAVLIGVIWLVCSLIRQLFKKPRSHENA